jgi:hypothetical protein
MNNLIKRIIDGEDLENTIILTLDRIYKEGPISITDMEILSYLKLYHPNFFNEYQDSVLNYLAVFYKSTYRQSLRDAVFGQYRKYIEEKYFKSYTPVQASIIKEINQYNCFSFSAPTSTGKSYVFMETILNTSNDVVVVVPSRALINEYYLKLNELVEDKTVNILTFIDKINTRYAQRSVFVVTPERCGDLFKQKEYFKVDLFLFDEAQLSNENSKRGLYFDSIVRRSKNAYPNAKFVFAHPFVKNPESQIVKNHFNQSNSYHFQYKQKNVGQLFLCSDSNWNFYHFGIEKEIMGHKRFKCKSDPIKEAILKGGSVLFYVSKAKIYNKSFLNDFSRYIDLCKDIEEERVEVYIEQLKQYTGGDTIANKNHYSQMIDLLKRGIVIHHGSLPLQTRIIIEQFTKEGLCRICFATSTLEQGINMPFDVVYLDRLEGSKPLSVKNLIGRAGRSTIRPQFDFGYVIINSPSRISKLRKIMMQDEVLETTSALEKDDPLVDDDFKEFKEAIINGTFSDEYNLTESELIRITSDNIDLLIDKILNSVFLDGALVTLAQLNKDLRNRLELYADFQDLYATYLRRELEPGEKNVFNTAIKIILWKVHGKTFKNICWYRYSYASKTHERELLERKGISTDQIEAAFYTKYQELPDKMIPIYNYLVGKAAKDVDYDFIMFDTYDYIDKLIGFKLSDIFYAALNRYYERKSDIRALRLARLIKYGTDNERHIWMLRYGLSFDDIEQLDRHIESIDSNQIVFRSSIYEVPEILRTSISRYLNS